MRKWITTFLMTLLIGSSSYATATVTGTEVDFLAGYRRDSLGWSFDIPACDPLFRTSTKFKDIDIFQLGVHARTNLGCNFYLRGAFSGGWILDGDFSENSDVFLSLDDFGRCFDEVDAFGFGFSSENVVDGKFVIDFNAAIGYPFYFCDCSMYLAPVLGWSFDEQNICIEDRERFVLEEFEDFFVPKDGENCCNDKFISRWYGPFIGLDFVYRPCNECWGLYAELEYHWARNKTKRHDFVGFSGWDHFNSTSDNAHGWVFNAGVDYAFCYCWTFGVNVKVQDWSSTRRHRECGSEFSDFFCSDNRIKTHASWHSFAVNLTLGRAF